MNYVYCAFKLYIDDEHRTFNDHRARVATSKTFLHYLCMWNRMVILRVSLVKRNCHVCFQISQGNHGDCCACSTATVHAHKNPPTDNPYKHVRLALIRNKSFLKRYDYTIKEHCVTLMIYTLFFILFKKLRWNFFYRTLDISFRYGCSDILTLQIKTCAYFSDKRNSPRNKCEGGWHRARNSMKCCMGYRLTIL